VAEHPVFKRDGLDIHVDAPVTLSQALLGGDVIVPTITGEVQVKIPAGTQPDEKRVLRGKGIHKPSGESGNQYIHFKVVIPKTLTSKQKSLIEEFRKEESTTKPFYSKIKDFTS